jgi:hypothetical protein
MALKAQYTAFLAAPTTDALAEAASLHYVPSLTTVRTAPRIVSQLTATAQLKRVAEKAVAGGAIESGDALMLDVETTIEFVSDGGGYLPGLDDNFLADRVVTFLVVCSNSFPYSFFLPPFLPIFSSSSPLRSLAFFLSLQWCCPPPSIWHSVYTRNEEGS